MRRSKKARCPKSRAGKTEDPKKDVDKITKKNQGPDKSKQKINKSETSFVAGYNPDDATFMLSNDSAMTGEANRTANSRMHGIDCYASAKLRGMDCQCKEGQCGRCGSGEER